MHKVWMWMHPVKVMTVLYIWLGVLAFLIHFLLLSTDRYNWFLESAAPKQKRAEIHSPMQPVPTHINGINFG